MPETGRRLFLAGLAALAAAPAAARRAPAPDPAPVLASARQPDGGFALVGLDAAGRVRFAEALPDRGHGIARRPGAREALIVARRPGSFALAFDPATGRVRARLAPPDGRLFYGHAAFSADGRLLYTTENAWAEGDGRIGVWDAADGYRRVGELASGGIGPHDLALAAGGSALWTANGGVLTHPDSGRAKLNVATMQPSLALVDRRDGALIAEFRLPAELHKLGIRHLDTAPDGTVAVAMQYEGPETDRVPLIGLRRRDGALRLLAMPEEAGFRTRNYCGDVAVDRSGAVVGGGFPRGGHYGFWGAADGRFLGRVPAADGCAIAAAPDGGFLVATGAGLVTRVRVDRDGIRVGTPARVARLQFDNHLSPAEPAFAESL